MIFIFFCELLVWNVWLVWYFKKWVNRNNYIYVDYFFFVLGVFLKVCFVGGMFFNRGRVEIYWNGCWGIVCKNGWDMLDVLVVCWMLGFFGVWIVGCCIKNLGGCDLIWLSDLLCMG